MFVTKFPSITSNSIFAKRSNTEIGTFNASEEGEMRVLIAEFRPGTFGSHPNGRNPLTGRKPCETVGEKNYVDRRIFSRFCC